MKILVCFKITKDLDYVLKQDWDTASIEDFDLSYVKRIINCYDEGTLENALILKDNDKKIEVDALTICEKSSEFINKHLLAVGFNNVINIMTDTKTDFTPYKNANRIYNAINNQNYDLVFLGYENAIGNNGIVPYALAKLMNCKVINEVSAVEYDKTQKVIATTTNTEFIKKIAIENKTILVFKNAQNAYLRFPTLRDRLKVNLDNCITYNGKDLDYENGLPKDIELINLKKQEDSKNCNFIDINQMVGEIKKVVK